MTLKYRYLRLCLASLCLLAEMHTSGFSMEEDNESLREKRAQSIGRSMTEQASSRMAAMSDSSENSAIIPRRVETAHRRVETTQRQPLGFFLSMPILPAIFAYNSNQLSICSVLSCLSNGIISLVHEHDSLIQKALGNKQSWKWIIYDRMILVATGFSLAYVLTGDEFFQKINFQIMKTRAVFKTVLYVYDWYYSETREA